MNWRPIGVDTKDVVHSMSKIPRCCVLQLPVSGARYRATIVCARSQYARCTLGAENTVGLLTLQLHRIKDHDLECCEVKYFAAVAAILLPERNCLPCEKFDRYGSAPHPNIHRTSPPTKPPPLSPPRVARSPPAPPLPQDTNPPVRAVAVLASSDGTALRPIASTPPSPPDAPLSALSFSPACIGN